MVRECRRQEEKATKNIKKSINAALHQTKKKIEEKIHYKKG